MSVKHARSKLPVTRKYVYLDHAATSPVPESVVEAVESFTAEKLYGDLFWESWEETAERTRRAVAGLLNARIGEIALVPNTSEGLGIIGNGLSYTAGDNIVTSNLEFTSNLFVWQALCKRYKMKFRAVSARRESLELDDFRDMIDKRTRLVAVSHVQFSNGFKIDLRELCKMAHEKGAYVVTDAVQSVGQTPVNVRQLDVDFLACSGYKWLLSPMATGFLYVRRDLIDAVYPSIVGYRSAESPEDFTFRHFKPAIDARRFEHGQLNFPGFAGMLEAIRFLKQYGIQRIERRIRKLTDQIIEGVKPIPHVKVASSLEPNHRSGILKLSCRGPELAEKRLWKKRIIISVRAGGLRISPHFYNSEDEIDYLLENLKKL
jgi:cysteine desulfurase/selenocysteine lyase